MESDAETKEAKYQRLLREYESLCGKVSVAKECLEEKRRSYEQSEETYKAEHRNAVGVKNQLFYLGWELAKTPSEKVEVLQKFTRWIIEVGRKWAGAYLLEVYGTRPGKTLKFTIDLSSGYICTADKKRWQKANAVTGAQLVSWQTE